MIETDVCIVGGGPTGLTASLLLSHFGIHHVLVEKRKQAQQAPAAHVINRRTMEIFRQVGLPVEDIYNLDKHGSNPLRIRWGLGLTGQSLGQLIAGTGERSGTEPGFSQDRLANISQPLLEAALKILAEKSSYCTYKPNHTWLGFSDEAVGAHLETQYSDIEVGNNEKVQIKSSFLLAADGANSAVRNKLKIKNLGPDNVATFLSLSCEVDQSKIEGRPDTLIDWCLDPELSGVVICHDPKKLSVYMRVLHEPFESITDYDDKKCHDILRKLYGENVPYKIRHKGTWRMTAQIAEKFQVGKVFLVGDSAHRFPPTGGLGLNSGIADVHNLAWKIAAVNKQNVNSDLLASYELERKAVVTRNRDESLTNFKKMDEVIRAIGLDPSKAAIPTRILNSRLIRHLPNALRKGIFELLVTPVKKTLARVSMDSQEGSRLRLIVQQAINNQQAHFDMPGLELGYVYRGGCALSKKSLTTPDSSVLTYRPSTLPGARFPHLALEQRGEISSTLNCISYQRYTLFTNGPLLDEVHFETFGLDVHEVDASILYLDHMAASLASQIDIPIGGWILVRPDGHIADNSA